VSTSAETEVTEVEEDMPITEEGINVYKTGLFAGRESAFAAAMEFWEARAASDHQSVTGGDQVMFPISVNTIIDTAAIIEQYFYYGQDTA
jgi:hypothetical protein